MAELTQVKDIVIGMATTWRVYQCLRCNETHAAQGESSGCGACKSGSVPAEDCVKISVALPMPCVYITHMEAIHMIDVLVNIGGSKIWMRAQDEADAMAAMAEQGFRVTESAWEDVTRWESVGPQRALVLSVVLA